MVNFFSNQFDYTFTSTSIPTNKMENTQKPKTKKPSMLSLNQIWEQHLEAAGFATGSNRKLFEKAGYVLIISTSGSYQANSTKADTCNFNNGYMSYSNKMYSPMITSFNAYAIVWSEEKNKAVLQHFDSPAIFFGNSFTEKDIQLNFKVDLTDRLLSGVLPAVKGSKWFALKNQVLESNKSQLQMLVLKDAKTLAFDSGDVRQYNRKYGSKNVTSRILDFKINTNEIHHMEFVQPSKEKSAYINKLDLPTEVAARPKGKEVEIDALPEIKEFTWTKIESVSVEVQDQIQDQKNSLTPKTINVEATTVSEEAEEECDLETEAEEEDLELYNNLPNV